MTSSKFEFLIAGIPEKVRYLEEQGFFKDATCLINKILTENKGLPSMLKSRLEWEPERIERIKKDYALVENKPSNLLKNRFQI